MRIGIIKGIVGLGVLSMLSTACNNDKTTPGYTYMDDMYRSPSIETYAADDNPTFVDGVSAMKPVEGTISRGHVPYEYENTQAGYDSARTTFMMPAEYKDEARIKGTKELYNNMCSHCHGTKGDGNGSLVENEKFAGVPSYDKTRLPDITPGSIYHVLMYGKGVMGSHASQLTEEERWEITSYVWYQLRGEAMETAEEDTDMMMDESMDSETSVEEVEVTENNSH